MKNFESLAVVCSTYIITLLLGLNNTTVILPLMYPPAGAEQMIAPLVSNPEDTWSFLPIFGYILVATAIMLLLMKFRRFGIINIIVWSSILIGAWTTLGIILDPILFDFSGLIATLLLAIAIYLRKEDAVLTNFMLMFTIAGIGSLLGASLSLTACTLLIIFMSVYDLIAVFWTKHMVTLAKEAKGRLALMFLLPVGDRVLGLGAGDIALPLTYCASVMAEKGIGYAIPTAYGGLLGLVWLYYYIMNKGRITLPALPPITIGLLIGYGMTTLILG